MTFGSVWNGRTPFLIRLRDHITRPSPAPEQFLDLIAATIAGLMPAGWVHRQLGAGATLCIDGVDEFPEAQRRVGDPAAARQCPKDRNPIFFTPRARIRRQMLSPGTCSAGCSIDVGIARRNCPTLNF